MSYTELEHGYQDLRSTSRPIFYVGDINSVQPGLGDPVTSSLYRSSKRGELSDGCGNEDECMGGSDLEGEGKQVLVGVCAMAKKSQSKPMKEILTRLEEFEYIKIVVFTEEIILKEPVEDWPIVDCLISFHSKGFPLDKAIHYANLRNPFIINNLAMQYDIQDRRRVYAILDSEGIEIPRYAVLDRDSSDPKHHELVESEDHVEVNGVTFNKPFVEKPVSAEDHNIYIYYPTSAGGGSQRLFRKIGSRSSVYSPESRVRKTGSYIYEDFMPTDGTDVKVYTVGPDYAHAEARKSPALDGKVERDSEGKEIRYPVILSNAEKLISRKVCLAFKQTVCGFDLLRANGKSFVCDVNGFSFVKNSNKYYDDCAKILGNMILRELAPTLHIPWSVPFQLDDPPIVPTTFGKMMELRCVVAVIRHGDRTPKQKMKVEVRHPKFFEIFAKYDGYKHGHVKLKRPKQLQEILDTARSLLTEIQHRAAGPELEEKQGKLEQLKSVLEMYGHFSGINRKVQMKYQPRGRPRGSSSDDGNSHNRLGEPSLVLILKWGGELTPAGRIQAEELGRIFRCMYPGGQGRHLSGEYAGAQGLGLLRLHSTFRHDLKIYASDEGRVQMTAAAFAKGLLALEGELTPILVQMVKSANTNGLLDNDCDSSKYQNMVKTRLHELLQQDREFTREDREQINPGNALSINDALDFVKNPVKCCQHVQALIQKLMDIVRIKKDDPKTKDAILYHGETWELMGRRWGKIEKDFCTKNKRFDISKIPDIYDCIKYDLQHNNHTLQFDHAEELYIYAKYLADIVIPQEYGLTVQEKLTIGQGICTPLLKKIRADLQRNIEESGEETVNRLNPRYSHGVSSPGRHVRTRLYFTSESHVHSLLTVLRYGGLLDVVTDEQWRRAMEYVSMVSELNYMSQIVVMLYEDPTKDPSSEERFHVELHFSPGVNCCVQKNLPPGPGFRPHSRNESSHNLETNSQCSTRIDEEDAELGGLDDGTLSPQQQSETSPILVETEETIDSTLDSPTTSRAIDMMDLDPNMMDEPYDSGFLQASAPIPISARTVAGHEAARLGSQLAASQRQRREREASSICEPRARSYDHQRQEKPDKQPRGCGKNEVAGRCEIDNFYERVESLVRNKSPRNLIDWQQQNCLGNATINSRSSSSPDLPGWLVEMQIGDKQRDTSEKALEDIILTQNIIEIERREGNNCSSEKHNYWDFAETQLLEKSTICERNEIADVGCETIALSAKSPIESNDNDRSSDNVPMNPRTEKKIVQGILTSRNVSQERIIDPSEPHVDTISWDTSVPIEPSESREIPCSNNNRMIESDRSVTRSPSCLGIPISLPHSVSSPELPVPMIETILEASDDQITSRNPKSSIMVCGDPFTNRSDKIMLTNCPACKTTSKSHQMSETRRYGRSKSALVLSTGDDQRGELGYAKITDTPIIAMNDRFPVDLTNCQSSFPHHRKIAQNLNHQSYDLGSSSTKKGSESNRSSCPNDQPKSFDKYSTSLPTRLQLSDRRMSLDVPSTDLSCCSTMTPRSLSNSRRTSLTHFPNQDSSKQREKRFLERSRSLSPFPERCHCYNCNVLSLIRQSVNLPPSERSNFETYFVRSLSHKFINCRCYKLSIESARASKRESRSASPNSKIFRTLVSMDNPDFPITRSLTCLDLRCSKFRRNGHLSLESCDNHHTEDAFSNFASPGTTSRQNASKSRELLQRRRSSPHNLGSPVNDVAHLIGENSSAWNENSEIKKSRPDVARAEVANYDNVSDQTPAICKMSDQLIVIDPPSLDRVTEDSNGLDDESVREANTRWVFSPEPEEITAEQDDVYQEKTPRSKVHQVAQNIPANLMTNRSLSRQLSCPAVVIDSSDDKMASPSIDPCCICTFVDDCDYGSSTNTRIHSQSHQSISMFPSMGFLTPEQCERGEKSSRLARKFSCPEIIVESSSNDDPEINQLMGSSTYLAYQKVRPENDSKNRDRRPSKKSKFSGRCKIARWDESEVTNQSGSGRSGFLRDKRYLVKQDSCPEIAINSAASSSCLHLHCNGTSKSRYDDECARLCLKSSRPLHSEYSRCTCTANHCQKLLRTHNSTPCSSCLCLNFDRNDDSDRETRIKTNIDHTTIKSRLLTSHESQMYYTNDKNPRHFTMAMPTLSSSSHNPRLQTQRSFSSPDTRPSIIQQPDPTCTARRHRHGISGQMSYFKLLGYNVSKKLTGSANSLFSTAVISGSSSAPNLKDMVPPHASAVAAIEGFGGVPPIRPLETLHNALSLRQLDSFLDMMTNAALFRTPASSPPKFPSPGGSIHGGTVIPNLSIGGINREYHSSDLEAVRYITPTPMHYKSGADGEGSDNRNQLSPTSPNSAGWSSEPQSFLSSGPSSPAPTSAGECSMSMSLVSNDGTQPFVGSAKIPTTPRLDIDFNNFCRSIDQELHSESRGSISYTDYYSNEDGLIRKSGPDLENLRERAARDELSQESTGDDEEEHTLTLRETEEHPKQDVKFIFDQNKDTSVGLVKPSSSYKKIGRFRVSSMDISDEDVRIKEAAAAAVANVAKIASSGSNLSLNRVKTVSSLAQEKSALVASLTSETGDAMKTQENVVTPKIRSRQKGKTIARSQSVSTPQYMSRKNENVRQSSVANTSSFSTMSCEDLENWKLTAASPPSETITTPDYVVQEEPILTVASSLKGSSNITVGFNVQDDEKE